MKIRRFRTTPSIWGFALSHGPYGWSFQVGPWVWTTEEDG